MTYNFDLFSGAKLYEIKEHKHHCNMHLSNLIQMNHAKELISKWTTVSYTFQLYGG